MTGIEIKYLFRVHATDQMDDTSQLSSASLGSIVFSIIDHTRLQFTT